ncbi:cyclic lactone autoinducer peptide [Clostridium chromiireducens]|nr:cyclic lactone autoinducer peptide [Clostridium chromiireducens]
MIKKLIGGFLKRISNSMITLAPASYCGHGVEEMPESMKNLR